MKPEITDNDRQIARGVRERMRERRISPEELAKRLSHPANKVGRQIAGQEHWTRATSEKYYVALELDDERTQDDTGRSVWERVESMTDEALDSRLRMDLPEYYKY